MATVKITVINSQDAGNEIQELSLPDTQTIRQLLESKQINTEDMTVRVRLNGQQVDYDLDDTLEDGSKVTVTPTNIKGA